MPCNAIYPQYDNNDYNDDDDVDDDDEKGGSGCIPAARLQLESHSHGRLNDPGEAGFRST